MNRLWLRHKNGGGKKHGNNCEVSADSLIDRRSSVGDSAEVYSSQIIHSLISDEAIITNATIHDSTIKDQARVIGTTDPWDALVVNNCELGGQSRVRDRAYLYAVNLTDVVVFGRAVLIGPWDLYSPVRIHAGEWTEPPHHLLIEGENIRVTISECVDDKYHLGCWCLPRETWFRKCYRQRLGFVSGWTPQQIELAYDTFATWAAKGASTDTLASEP